MTDESLTGRARLLLDLPLPANPAGAGTVREYLSLLATVAMDLKRPFGESAWQYDLYRPMVAAGIITGTLDDGFLDSTCEFDIKDADALIAEAARLLGQPPVAGPDHGTIDASRGICDVAGYCPMGCGPHLFLAHTGVIRCMAPDCPRPDAAGLILADRETEHIVAFTATGFTVRHPLRDRLEDDLYSCTIHTMCNALPGPPGGITGRYRVRISGEGHAHGLELEFLEEPNVN